MTKPISTKGTGAIYTLYEMGVPIQVGSSKELAETLNVTVGNFHVIRYRKGVYKNVYTIKEGTHEQ